MANENDPRRADLSAIAKEVGYKGARVGETVGEYLDRIRQQLSGGRAGTTPRECMESRRARRRERLLEKARMRLLQEVACLGAEEKARQERLLATAQTRVRDRAIDISSDIVWVYKNLGLRTWSRSDQTKGEVHGIRC